jgi:hypothetical protein
MRPLVALLLALVVVSAAAADIGVVRVAPTRVHPGATVRVTVDGYLGPTPWLAMPVVVVARAHEPHPYRCGANTICEPTRLPRALRRSPFHLVGTIRRWRVDPALPDHGRATVAFHAPRARGVYVPMVVCDRCVRGPRVSLIATRGMQFRVY